MPEPTKRKTSNGSGPRKKSVRQDAPSAGPSREIPQELATPTSRPGTSVSRGLDYLQIIVTGPAGCGRSGLVCSYMDQVLPPSGVTFVSKQYLKRRPSGPPVMIWDLNASDGFSEYRKASYQEADVAFLCYDVRKPMSIDTTDEEVFEKLLSRWYNDLVRYCKHDIKIILVGLKRDLKANPEFSEGNFFSRNEISYAARHWQIDQQDPFREVSALMDREEVVALFDYAISIAESQPKVMFVGRGFEILQPS